MRIVSVTKDFQNIKFSVNIENRH